MMAQLVEPHGCLLCVVVLELVDVLRAQIDEHGQSVHFQSISLSIEFALIRSVAVRSMLAAQLMAVQMLSFAMIEGQTLLRALHRWPHWLWSVEEQPVDRQYALYFLQRPRVTVQVQPRSIHWALQWMPSAVVLEPVAVLRAQIDRQIRPLHPPSSLWSIQSVQFDS